MASGMVFCCCSPSATSEVLFCIFWLFELLLPSVWPFLPILNFVSVKPREGSDGKSQQISNFWALKSPFFLTLTLGVNFTSYDHLDHMICLALMSGRADIPNKVASEWSLYCVSLQPMAWFHCTRVSVKSYKCCTYVFFLSANSSGTV